MGGAVTEGGGNPRVEPQEPGEDDPSRKTSKSASCSTSEMPHTRRTEHKTVGFSSMNVLGALKKKPFCQVGGRKWEAGSGYMSVEFLNEGKLRNEQKLEGDAWSSEIVLFFLRWTIFMYDWRRWKREEDKEVM